MPITIFDLVHANEISAYWEGRADQRAPYLGDELFPVEKKLGLDLKWIKGSKGLPVALKLSAFDVKAIPRDRIGFDHAAAEMPFFKESTLIDEKLRQELNIVMGSGNQAYIDSIMRRVFDDETNLIEGASVSRERMRMQLLTSGVITLASNGQAYSYDYGVPSGHKGNATVAWSNTATADPVSDIQTWQDKVQDDTGVRPTRALCSRKTWGYLLRNETIKKSIYVMNNGVGFMSTSILHAFLLNELQVDVQVYTKKFTDEAGNATAYVPDDVFSLFPVGALGKTWFGTTPEESDLMAGSSANVSIVDTGVAITTMKQVDPVNVETKVTQICLPSWETADQCFIADLTAAG